MNSHVSKESLQQVAYEAIHAWICEGKLAQGSVTSEVQLSASLDMSRTPVRSALQRLEWEGYLRVVPKHGVLVLDHSARKVGDLIDLICSQLLYAIHTAHAANRIEMERWLERCAEQLDALVAQNADETERCEQLIALEYEAFRTLIRIARNAEMEQQFVHTAFRITWNMNKRRWVPPFFMESYERFRSLLAQARKPAEDLYPSLAKYAEQLKRTWS